MKLSFEIIIKSCWTNRHCHTDLGHSFQDLLHKFSSVLKRRNRISILCRKWSKWFGENNRTCRWRSSPPNLRQNSLKCSNRWNPEFQLLTWKDKLQYLLCFVWLCVQPMMKDSYYFNTQIYLGDCDLNIDIQTFHFWFCLKVLYIRTKNDNYKL